MALGASGPVALFAGHLLFRLRELIQGVLEILQLVHLRLHFVELVGDFFERFGGGLFVAILQGLLGGLHAFGHLLQLLHGRIHLLHFVQFLLQFGGLFHPPVAPACSIWSCNCCLAC